MASLGLSSMDEAKLFSLQTATSLIFPMKHGRGNLLVVGHQNGL